jgi:hypothetical protein
MASREAILPKDMATSLLLPMRHNREYIRIGMQISPHLRKGLLRFNILRLLHNNSLHTKRHRTMDNNIHNFDRDSIRLHTRNRRYSMKIFRLGPSG